MKHVFILNPTANGGRAEQLITNINNTAKRYGLNYVIHKTEYPTHATEIVKYYRNEEAIIHSVGGDGTLNEVVTGLMKYPNVLSVIPAGTGNDYYRSIKNMPTDRFKTDVGMVNNRYFINVTGLGLDADISKNATMFKGKVPQKQVYNTSILYTFLKYKDQPIEYNVNGKWYNSQATIFTVCNGEYYGGGYYIAPGAKINDGMFDVYCAEAIPKLNIPSLILKLAKGKHLDSKYVKTFKTKKMTIKSEKEVAFGIDGETIYGKKFVIKLAHRQLDVYHNRLMVEEILGKRNPEQVPERPKTLEYPETSVYKFLEERSLKNINKEAYEYFGKAKTFQDLLFQIDEAANGFLRIGVKKGDVVTICTPNIPEGVIAFYALNKIGAVSSIIHPLSAKNEVEEYLKLSNSSYLVSADFAYNNYVDIIKNTKIKKTIIVSLSYSMNMTMKTMFSLTKGRKIKQPVFSECVLRWDDFIKAGKNYSGTNLVKIEPHQTACILYSGGTTGTSKGIALSNHSFNALSIQAEQAIGNIKKEYAILGIMPIFHGFGLGVGIHTVLTLGAKVILIPQFNAKTFHRLLKKHKPNILVGVPTLFEALLANKKIKKMDLSFLKIVVSGGDTLSVSLKRKIDDLLIKNNSTALVREGYGLTESLSAVCVKEEDDYEEFSIGIPFADTNVKIVEPKTDIELPNYQDGEIVINGLTVMNEYVNNKEETAETIRKHSDGKMWLHTGDLGYVNDQGKVFFKQRIKRMIVSSGYNIYPIQIENIINSHPEVSISIVIGIKHPYKGQVAKAYVVLKDEKLDKKKIEKELKERFVNNLPVWSIPKEIVFKDSLPKTKVGKVDYKELEKE